MRTVRCGRILLGGKKGGRKAGKQGYLKKKRKKIVSKGATRSCV